jgi:hypothetical protein
MRVSPPLGYQLRSRLAVQYDRAACPDPPDSRQTSNGSRVCWTQVRAGETGRERRGLEAASRAARQCCRKKTPPQSCPPLPQPSQPFCPRPETVAYVEAPFAREVPQPKVGWRNATGARRMKHSYRVFKSAPPDEAVEISEIPSRVRRVRRSVRVERVGSPPFALEARSSHGAVTAKEARGCCMSQESLSTHKVSHPSFPTALSAEQDSGVSSHSALSFPAQAGTGLMLRSRGARNAKRCRLPLQRERCGRKVWCKARHLAMSPRGVQVHETG